jgi:hypothetical protein
MISPQVQYIGFTTKGSTREYTLRLKATGGEARDFVIAITSEAFIAHRARYQDGPDICFLKLQKELLAAGEALPAAYLTISDADLEEYRVAHAPRAPQTRHKPPPPAAGREPA